MKKIFIPLMLCAVALSSCSKDEPNAVSGTTDSSDLVQINVSSGTTRGTDTTTTTLEGNSDDGYGSVSLFIFDSVDEDGEDGEDGVEEEAGAYVFEFDGSDWNLDNATITWSDITFPATFLSMHDGEAQELEVDVTNCYATLEYSVDGATSEHFDLVYHASTLTAMPTGGVVNAIHKHALSKIHLYAATGGNKVYVTQVEFVNVSNTGTVTIAPLVVAENDTTTGGVSWEDGDTVSDYEYFDIDTYETDDKTYSVLQSTDTDGDPIINDDDDAPFMIIPQAVVATTSDEIVGYVTDGTAIAGSYIKVIYYMTDSNNNALVGYSSVSEMPNASDYVENDDEDEDKEVLYVMAAFPIEYTFEVNKEYDITLGLGKSGSTGGLLLYDYYVDKDGDPVTLTLVDDINDDDPNNDDSKEVEIPEIDPGDSILGDSDDEICITVTAHSWDDGDDTTIGITAD